MSTTVTNPHPSAADRLRFTPDGHVDPAQLLDCLIDADTRTASTGLVYLAEHTRAADLAPAAGRPGLVQRALPGTCRRSTDTTAGAAPREWTFTDRVTGDETPVKCMPGCVEDHTTENFLADVCCYTGDGQAVMLPIDDGTVEDRRVLGVGIRCTPYGGSMSARVPHAVVEVVEGHYIEELDPDGLAVLIVTLQARVDALRAAHAQLVDVRAAYMAATLREVLDAAHAGDFPSFRRGLEAVEVLAAGAPGAVAAAAGGLGSVER